MKFVSSKLAAATGAGLLLSLSPSLAPAAASIDQALGHWKHPEKGTLIETQKCGEDLCVVIFKTKEEGKKDDNNPDAALRTRLLNGVTIIDHAKADGDNSWKGQVYNADDGKIYSGYVKLLSPTELQMKGCTLSVFCKTVVWTKEPAQ